MGSHLPVKYTNWDKSLIYVNINKYNVKQALENTNPNKPAGPDQIPSLFFKQFARSLAPIVSFIFNLSLHTGIFPEIFKQAIVIPLYKGKGKKNDPVSYRPISLLPPLSKVFERLVSAELQRFLNLYNKLTPAQHGFRSEFSTQSATLQFTNDCYEAGEKRLYTGAIHRFQERLSVSTPGANNIQTGQIWNTGAITQVVSILYTRSKNASESWKFIISIS